MALELSSSGPESHTHAASRMLSLQSLISIFTYIYVTGQLSDSYSLNIKISESMFPNVRPMIDLKTVHETSFDLFYRPSSLQPRSSQHNNIIGTKANGIGKVL